MGRPATRKQTKALGMIDPGRLYSSTGLMRHAGLGQEKQREMRASGIVKPIDVGNYRWYRGSEVIAWIESQGSN